MIEPMKVLHVYTEHRGKGGAERFAQVNMQLCREMGLTVEAFTRSSDDLPHNFQGRLEAGIGAVYPKTGLRQFTSVLEGFQPDVVHLYDYFPLISPWMAPLCAKRGIPVVMHCVHYRLTCPVATHFSHGELCTRCTDGREYWAVLRNCRENLVESVTLALHNILVRQLRPLTANISRFIAPSEFTREWLIKHALVGPQRITTVMPFVDIPSSSADPGAGEYIAFAGRFAAEKGIQTLIQAARLTGLPIRLCRNATHKVHVSLPDTVEEVITQNRAELDAFYRGARMLVVPSEWFETFGLVGAEAMAHGIPVVAARIGALANLVDDGVNGLLFNSADPQDLAVKLGRLWNSPDLCRQFGLAARQKVLTHWTAERYFERLMAVYQEVAPSSSPLTSLHYARLDGHSHL